MQSIEEQVAQFYEWEALGRGHLLWEQPVRVEPPFTPFHRKEYSSRQAPVDDGQSRTVLSWLWEGLIKNASADQPDREIEPVVEEDEEQLIGPVPDDAEGGSVEIQVLLPESVSISPAQAEQFLLSLDQCQESIAFEIIGNKDAILIQFTVREVDAGWVHRQLEAHFPSATILSVQPCSFDSWTNDRPSLILELGLSKEFMLPLREVSSFAQDPIVSIAGALSGLGTGEMGVLQIIFEPIKHPWKANIERAILRADGSAFFDDDPGFTSASRRKLERSLFAVVCRIGVQALDYDRVIHLATQMASSISLLNHPDGNELLPLDNEAYGLDDHYLDLVQRKSRRSGMIWNAAELISLVHPPNNSVRLPKLMREAGKTKKAPSITLGNSTILGENTHAGVTQEVSLSTEQRLRHTHLIGTSGSGKSTLLRNLILQDIQNGQGCAVLDPHGDLVDQILREIPKERMDDVILFNPSDEEFPIGLNILDAHSELEKNLLASDLVSVFKRLSNSWGDQMTTVLRNAILAMLESSQGGTLSDLRRFLVEPDFRNEFLKTVEDTQVIYFWKKEFPMLAGRPQAPLLTRLNTFLGPKMIRYMVSQRENKVNFAEIMDSGKIFLAKLSQGALGEENSYLLGTLLVSKFYQIAMSRQAMEAQERRPFWLFIDEFHNFICTSMASILTGARKYGLGLTLAHQEMKQIDSRDADVGGSVIANPYLRICFRLGDEDARKLAKGFSFFEEKDLQNLAIGEAICRIEKAEYDFNLRVPKPEMGQANHRDIFNHIRDHTREKYASPRSVIESQLKKEQEDLLKEDPVPKAKTNPESTPKSRPSAPEPQQKVKKEDSSAEVHVTKTGQETVPTNESTGGEPSISKEKDQNKAKVPTTKPPEPPKHEDIKEYLITEAEKLHFKVEREVWVLDGKGRVDLVFTRGKLKIACEIANTTTDEHEVGNITKCIEAGFTLITLVSALPERLKRISELYRQTVTDIKPDVGFKSPEEFVEILRRFAKADPAGGEIEQSKPTKQQFDFKGSDQSDAEKKQKEKDLLEQLKKNLKGKDQK